MKQKFTEMKGEIHKSRIIVGDLNTPISTMTKETDNKSVRVCKI